MPKIVVEGKYPENNKTVCDECECIFQYYTREVHTDFTTPDEEAFFGGFGMYKWIRCPQCGNKVILDYSFEETDPFPGLTKLINKIKSKFKNKGEKK